MPRCDIIIPVWNQKKTTKACIDAIAANTDYPFRLVIIDNASDPDTRDYLAEVSHAPELDVFLIRNEINQGFIKAVNTGISASKAEYVCILNNDTIVSQGWLSEMVKVLESDPLIGIVNPSSNTLGQRIPVGMSQEDYAGQMRSESGKSMDLGAAVGFCMLVRKSLFDEIGVLDEGFGMGNFEDTDFSYRALSRGYRSVRAIAAYVFHQESKSFSLIKHFKKDFNENRKIFEKRWGRPKRVLFIMVHPGSGSRRFRDEIKKNAESNNWVYVACPRNIRMGLSHSRISVYRFKRFFWVKLVSKIFFKKKKFDRIICDDLAVAFLIKPLGFARKAEVRFMEERLKPS